jgi:type IV pilus assembly protein PilV
MRPHAPISMRSRASRSRGATLLEALIAILILSIGLLGMAGLQAASLRYSQGGWARAGVATGVSSLAEQVRSNPDSTTTAYLLGDDYATQRSAISSLSSSKDCSSATCSPAELAEYQMVTWRLALDATLPGAAAFVTGDRATGYQATILWFDKSFTKVTSSGEQLDSAASCGSSTSGIAGRTCCPAAASAPAGVRCTTFTVVP